MRTREWYGWHFPELTKIIGDNLAYAKSVKKMGNLNLISEDKKLLIANLINVHSILKSIINNHLSLLPSGYRTNAVNTDLSDILPEDIEQEVKQAAEISMGTEISEEDILNITYLCDQVSYLLFINRFNYSRGCKFWPP